MRTLIYGFCFSVLFSVTAFSQSKPEVISLWEKGAPGFENRKDIPEQSKDWWVKNINNPTLTLFRPSEDISNGCAVIVAPGGGFRELVFDGEGRMVAEYLNKLGVTVFVLKYRLPNEENSPYTFKEVRQDAYRAVRMVRSRASEFKIDPARIGMMGFSAGGAVVMMVAFDNGDGDPKAPDPTDKINGRPDFQIMVYPGGKAPEKVPAGSPPAFLICANDDEYGCDEVTIDLLLKFRKANVPVEAFFLARGKHAFNMGDRSTYKAVRNWPDRMADWLNDSGYLKK
ncbi:MAG TPA: alpha/beta hydrolase [Bacteroidales bacterium]|nr:alpha/beta hydrolase [Bacteroidales bacterium]